jgi:hypothetical protein
VARRAEGEHQHRRDEQRAQPAYSRRDHHVPEVEAVWRSRQGRELYARLSRGCRSDNRYSSRTRRRPRAGWQRSGCFRNHTQG